MSTPAESQAEANAVPTIGSGSAKDVGRERPRQSSDPFPRRAPRPAPHRLRRHRLKFTERKMVHVVVLIRRHYFWEINPWTRKAVPTCIFIYTSPTRYMIFAP
ncbi:hypothetical protein EVAR_44819_1 [Eumeta japonica]|uniref:Uncharacterized protein n=1 Tax=Eumeta variegata TaxID=151549 RepID=A0A4C1X8U8_EUMVA|nr:hypothetical protein EVAR_44819_1 [Eumeta japonica]